jgi:hypothetical protein
MPTVASTNKQISETIDKFEDWAQPDEDDWMTMVLVSLRSDLTRSYDVFNYSVFLQSSYIPTTAWAAATQTLWVYGTLAKNAALKISPEVSLKFGRLLEDLKAIVDG